MSREGFVFAWTVLLEILMLGVYTILFSPPKLYLCSDVCPAQESSWGQEAGLCPVLASDVGDGGAA